MFFRSNSRSNLPKDQKQPDQPPQLPKNPLGKEKVDLLIDLETQFNQSKLNEETVLKLMEIYSVGLG